jgi:hypothetical protein
MCGSHLFQMSFANRLLQRRFCFVFILTFLLPLLVVKIREEFAEEKGFVDVYRAASWPVITHACLGLAVSSATVGLSLAFEQTVVLCLYEEIPAGVSSVVELNPSTKHRFIIFV